MVIVSFVFDKEMDINNIWNAVNSSSQYGHDFVKSINPKIVELCKNVPLETVRGNLKEIRKEIHDSVVIEEILHAVRKSWKNIEEEYIGRVERFTLRPFFSGNVTGFGTSINKCPYNPREKTFFFNIFSSIFHIIQTSAHEIFHMQFHEYFFDEISKKIGSQNAHDIKEAISVILNLEFKDLLIVEDKGYESHREIREFIVREWNFEKNFNKLLENSVKYIQELKGGVK